MSAQEILSKLRVKAGQRGLVLGAPESYRPVLDALPDGVSTSGPPRGQYDFLHLFATNKADLEHEGPVLRAALKPGGILWVSYPKGSAIPTDLKRDVVREVLAAAGLQVVSQVAIDEVWSALRAKIA